MAKPSGDKKSEKKSEKKVVASNRKARFDYHILETVEAGICLIGPEVKALRTGQASIVESFGRIESGEIWLINVHIPEYLQATYNNHETRRKRKLLLSKKEIRKLDKGLAVKGTTLVPLDLYFNERGFAKVTLALVRGKQEFDKRESIKERETKREISRFTRRG